MSCITHCCIVRLSFLLLFRVVYINIGQCTHHVEMLTSVLFRDIINGIKRALHHSPIGPALLTISQYYCLRSTLKVTCTHDYMHQQKHVLSHLKGFLD